jgi:transcriptional regulator with XRE-family HTH domain
MARVSERLHRAVKTARIRQYELARALGVHHSTLSCWLNGISDVRKNDPRILKLGELVQVPPEECFDNSSEMKADGAGVLPAA